jgi:hypothetical protein
MMEQVLDIRAGDHHQGQCHGGVDGVVFFQVLDAAKAAYDGQRPL